MRYQFCVLGAVCLVVAVIYGKSIEHARYKRWEEMPNVTFNFDCTDRAVGFFADLEFQCMIFHMCDEDGRRIPHMCGHETAFNQQYRICDWINNFDCNDAPNWYYLNELTYVTDPPKQLPAQT